MKKRKKKKQMKSSDKMAFEEDIFKSVLRVQGKSKWSAAWFDYISTTLKLAYNKKQTV